MPAQDILAEASVAERHASHHDNVASLLAQRQDELPSMRFDWFPRELPEGTWPAALRQRVYATMRRVGFEALNVSEFASLEKLYREFTSVFPRLLVDRGDVDRAADLYTLLFYMIWRPTQVLSSLEPFNKDVVQPFTAFLSRYFPKETPRPAVRDIPRIAYLSETNDLVNGNAVGRITASLMLGQHALREKADWPILYCTRKPVPSLWDFAYDHGLVFWDMARDTPSETVEAIVEQIKADEIDILIADINSAVPTMVFQRRPARVQVFHENGFAPWAISELDLAFLGITKPSPTLFAEHVAVFRTPRNTAFVFQKIERPAAQIDAFRNFLRQESGIANPSVVYGVYGRMVKITAAYMAQVEAILLQSPDAIFFAGGTGSSHVIDACKQASPVGSRIVVHNGYIDGHTVSECIDVFLDSFPFPGGMSCVEVQARGVPVVWMAPPDENQAMAIIADQRDPQLKAQDASRYVSLALQLADSEARANSGLTASSIAKQFGDMTEQAQLVEGHLRDAWAKARRNGSL